MFSIRVGASEPAPGVAPWSDGLDLVELKRTFDRPPSVTTAQQWRADAPEGLVFTLRAPRCITHPHPTPAGPRRGKTVTIGFQDTPKVRKAWKSTLELIRALEAPLVIFECPASFTPIDENIANLTSFVQWAHRDGIKLAWEPRGKSWTDDLVRRLCRELSLTHVVDPFERRPMRGRPPYFRLRSRGGASDEDLADLRDLCTPDPEITPQPEQAFCVFTNRRALDDARRFARMLDATPSPAAHE